MDNTSWNYYEFILKRKFRFKDKSSDSFYLKLKFFPSNDDEEYYAFENRPETQRKEYDGITFTYKTHNVEENDWRKKLAISFTTVIKNSFDNNSIRFELTLQQHNSLPLSIWVQHGYTADLIDYYKEVTSVGIGLEFRNVLTDL